jgi:hypothetical protein
MVIGRAISAELGAAVISALHRTCGPVDHESIGIEGVLAADCPRGRPHGKLCVTFL